jgi:hypothetical protein
MSVRTWSSVLSAALACAIAPLALADDGTRPQPPPIPAGSQPRLMVFGTGADAVRFQVLHDRPAGRMTFRLADGTIRLARAPVAILRTTNGPREVALVGIDGDQNAWSLTDTVLRDERFDGTLRLAVGDRTIDGPIVFAAATTPGPAPASAEPGLVPLHGGRIVAFPDCAYAMEVVQDFEKGKITLVQLVGVRLDRPPALTITEGGGVTMAEAAPVESKPNTWEFSSAAFKSRDAIARVRILIDERPCEASLSIPPHGGRIVIVPGGPQVEVVRSEDGTLRFYVLEERLGERRFALENPTLVVTTGEGDRSLALVAVKDMPRTWELARFEAPAGARILLRATMSGRVVETNVAPVVVLR